MRRDGAADRMEMVPLIHISGVGEQIPAGEALVNEGLMVVLPGRPFPLVDFGTKPLYELFSLRPERPTRPRLSTPP